ncbi:TonB-dependent receptor [Flavobacteriaceae bacterium S356]|uniref:TonB-dependent receptor n=1 Tax=Asprobacillus argus TaxID=3076534 RepID=A0ABU3LG39_9FLAO|nr:TonB-dependent receptor [Flavobacteriaceae bacterium S356]
MSKKIYLIFVFVGLSATAIGQKCNYTFKGVVKDFHDGTPIIGAALQIESSKKYATSDIEGNFVFKNLCSSSFTIIVSHISCDTKKIAIDLEKEPFREIRLEHHIEELHEVTVKATSTKKTKTAQESVLKTEVLEKYSSLSLGDAIKEIPGVSSINTGNAIVKPVINGLHSSRVLVMVNNVRLQDQEWGIEHAPNVDINAAGSISLIKGANALEYGGDAIGGVIVLNPKRVYNRDSIFGKTIVHGNSNGRGYGLSTSLTKSSSKGWYTNGQASYKRSGDYRAPDYFLTNTGNQSNSFNINTGLRKFEHGFNIYYSYLKNKIAILRSSHIGNVEDLVNAINSQQPHIINGFSYDISAPRQEVTHQILKTNFYKRFKDLGRFDLQYDYQKNRRFEFDIRVGDDRDVPAVDLKLTTHTLKSTLKLDAYENSSYKFGIATSYQENFANPDTGVRRLIPDYKKYDLGIFSIGNFEISDTFSLEAGLRYDWNRIDAKKFYQTSRWIERGYNVDFADLVIQDLNTQLLVNPVFNYHNISVSLGGYHILNENSKLIFNYGLSNRAPNPSELFSDGLHHSAARIELGDLRMDKETSNRVSTTYSYNGPRTTFHIEAFYNNIKDFIYLEPTGVETTVRGAFPVWEYKQTNAALFGIDTDFRHSFDQHWSFQNKSSYIKGTDITANRPLIDIPAFKTINVIRYSNPAWSDFEVELESQWVSRQNDYPDNNFMAFIPRTNSNVLVDISTPPPAYHVLNFSANFDWKISKEHMVNVGFTMNNILNTSYREYLNRLRYFADELGRNIMLQLKFNY